MKLKLECSFNPKDLADTCHKCADRPEECTVGVMGCPWIENIKGCPDITEEDWDKFIRENLDMDRLFRR